MSKTYLNANNIKKKHSHTLEKVNKNSIDDQINIFLKKNNFYSKISLLIDILIIFMLSFLSAIIAMIIMPYNVLFLYSVIFLICLIGWLVKLYLLKEFNYQSSHINKQNIYQHLECFYSHIYPSLWQVSASYRANSDGHYPKKDINNHNINKDNSFMDTDNVISNAKGFSLNLKRSNINCWYEAINIELNRLKKVFYRPLKFKLIIFFLVFFLSFILIFFNTDSILNSSKYALTYLGFFKKTDELVVIKGASVNEKKVYKLSYRSPPIIKLAADNLVEVRIYSKFQKDPLTLEIKPWLALAKKNNANNQTFFVNNIKKNNNFKTGAGSYLGDNYQSFSLNLAYKHSDLFQPENVFFNLNFKINRHSAVFVKELSQTKPLFYVYLDKVQLPQVGLVANNAFDNKEPYLSTDPLSVKISSVSHHPLTKIALKIQSSSRQFNELVLQISAKNIHSIVKDHIVRFDNYLSSDVEHFHIIAQAYSVTAHNQQLMAESDPIEITVSSSFGEYQNFLTNLEKHRNQILNHDYEPDPFTAKADYNADQRNNNLINSLKDLINSADAIKFFDFNDRVFLNSLKSSLAASDVLTDSLKKDQLQKDLDHFLTVHQFLNDQKIDRDFFFAMQRLSSKIVAAKTTKKNLEKITDKIADYLLQRQSKWEQRIKSMDKSYYPKNKKDIIDNKHIINSFAKIEKTIKASPSVLDADSFDGDDRDYLISSLQKNQALSDIVQLTNDYQDWITDLYKNHKSQLDGEIQKIHKDLKNNQDHFFDLQKAQDQIATKLDDFNKKSKSNSLSIPKDWQTSYKNQLNNIDSAKKLKATLKNQAESSKLAQNAIKKALNAMNSVINSAGNNDFIQAESHADNASRKLRVGARNNQAAAHRHQKRTALSKDNRNNMESSVNSLVNSIEGGFDGNASINLNLKTKHLVDKKYRDMIIDDAALMQSQQSELDSRLMDYYLRQALR